MAGINRYTKEARVWVGTLAAVAAGAAAWCAWNARVTLEQVVIMALLSIFAATAHAFPIRSIFDGASIRLTSVSIVAAAILLPPVLMPVIAVVSITPETWIRRRADGAMMRWTFNVSQTAVAGIVTNLAVRWITSQGSGDLLLLLGIVASAVIFSVVQALLVGIVISLNSRIPLRRTDTLTISHLQSAVVTNLLGALVGGMWLAKPILVVLVLPLAVLTYFLSRSAHLTQLAQVDVKTGLHNYRHFERVLDEEIGRARRLGRPVSVLFADLDLLRAVNNTYGHLAGDKVLHQVATILTETLRKGDLIARFGGEEFVALLTGTDAEEATFLADRVRERVANHEFVLDDGRTVRCTISIGVACCPEDTDDATGLVQQADLAMYRAKQTRNTVARVRVLPPVPRIHTPGTPEAPVEPRPQRGSRLPGIALWSVVAAGVLAVAWSVWQVQVSGGWFRLLPLLVAAIATEFIKVRVFEAKREQISLSFTIVVTMLAVTIMPAGAVLVSLVAGLVHVLVIQKSKNTSKLLFNLANPSLAAASAGLIYGAIDLGQSFDHWNLVGAMVAVVAFHLVNFGLISLMISLHAGRPLLKTLREGAWYSPTKIFLGLTGALLYGVYTHIGWTGVAMFVVPLLILRYTLSVFAHNSEKTIAVLQAAKAEVEEAHQQKEETLRHLIETVASIIDARDNAVAGHSKQVAKYAVAIGRELGLPPSELALLQTAAMLHDMGKVAIPEAILNKPERLSVDEYELVKRHASIGERILAEVSPLSAVAQMVGEHHERFDGQGYPRGKKAEEISIGGRIIAVADTLDSILSDRPYSKGRPLPWALTEIDRCSGTQFDPQVVMALHRVVRAEGSEYFGNSARPVERVS